MWSPSRGPVALAALAVLIAWSVSSAQARAHGGPPSTHEVLLGSDSISLVTSHGFFSEDTNWEWICEEATGADLASSATRTPSRWLVGTSVGLVTSSEGCLWTLDPSLTDIFILRVFQDTLEPERAWIATQEGLWVMDGEEDAVLVMEPDLSLRHVGQRADGTLLLVGFDGPRPTALIGQQRIPLSAETGRMEVLSADDEGRFYVRFPAGFHDRLIRVSEDGAEVLIPKTEPIRDVRAMGDDLYVLYKEGVSWSSDDGVTWSEPEGDAITCLRPTSEGILACPPAMSPAALLYAPTLDSDPADWAWETALNFNEVTTNSCSIGTTAGNVCPYLWPVVREELAAGAVESKPGPTEASGAPSGCALHTAPFAVHWSLYLLMSLWAVVVRSRRSLIRS